MDLTFEDDPSDAIMGEQVAMPLKEDGAAVAVTVDNVDEYVQLLAEHRLVGRIREQVCTTMSLRTICWRVVYRLCAVVGTATSRHVWLGCCTHSWLFYCLLAGWLAELRRCARFAMGLAFLWTRDCAKNCVGSARQETSSFLCAALRASTCSAGGASRGTQADSRRHRPSWCGSGRQWREWMTPGSRLCFTSAQDRPGCPLGALACLWGE